jgi:hypothetical protein
VKLLDIDGLVREDEANRILVVKFDVFSVEGDSGEIAIHSPARGMEEWTVKIKRSSDGGVAAELGTEIGVPKRVEIKLIHAEREIGGIAVAQLDVTADEQRTALQVGIAVELKSAALGNGLQIQVAGEFVIEGEVADVNSGIDDGCIQRAGGFEGKIGAAFDG